MTNKPVTYHRGKKRGENQKWDGPPTDHEGLVRMYLNKNRWLMVGDVLEEDYMQAGLEGVWAAQQRFNPERGNTFATFAVWWIRAKVYRLYQNESTTIRYPSGHREKLRVEGKPRPLGCASLNMPVSKGQGPHRDVEMQDLIPGEYQCAHEGLEQKELSKMLRGLVANLSERDRDIIENRLMPANGEPLKLRELGEKYGVSRERIRQLEVEILRKLRRMMNWLPEDVQDILRLSERGGTNVAT